MVEADSLHIRLPGVSLHRLLSTPVPRFTKLSFCLLSALLGDVGSRIRARAREKKGSKADPERRPTRFRAEMAELYKNQKLGKGSPRAGEVVSRGRCRLRRPERNYEYWLNLEAHVHSVILIGPTGTHLSQPFC